MLLNAQGSALPGLISGAQGGALFIVSGPSGVGKGTIVKALLERDAQTRVSVSVTTRAPRPGEVEGESYFFRTPAEFERMVKSDELLEFAKFGDHWYGTPRQFVEEQLSAGFDVILEIEVQGGIQVREKMPGGVYIFVLPPSTASLVERLKNRRSESPEAIEQRLKMVDGELSHLSAYDYRVVNDDLERAVQKFQAIFSAERCRVHRSGSR
ncbi:MAG: guanylate kinase [Candidatus Sericytochromatia bacterium]|nr:guanylate kinase [Candidatus Sericytochromatia bacterium]